MKYTKIKYRGTNNKTRTHHITLLTPKSVHIIREKFKQKKIKEWYLCNRGNRIFLQQDDTYQDIITLCQKPNPPKWSKVKTLIKQKLRDEQMRTWLNDPHGRILKQYKRKWGSNIHYLKSNLNRIKQIRQMRIGS